jgi:uncharacterized protein YkwD
MPRFSPAALVLLLVLASGCAAAQPRFAPGPERPDIDLPDLERRVLSELNRARQTHGRAPLQPDTALAALARAHSADMRDRVFFAHRNPDGLRAGDRARRAGYAFRSFGENLFRGHLYETINELRRGDLFETAYLWYAPDDLARTVVQSWLESPGHRDNMLSRAFDFGGVGVAAGPEHEVFVTLNLSAR